jgi:hypothetical protein
MPVGDHPDPEGQQSRPDQGAADDHPDLEGAEAELEEIDRQQQRDKAVAESPNRADGEPTRSKMRGSRSGQPWTMIRRSISLTTLPKSIRSSGTEADATTLAEKTNYETITPSDK